MKSAPAIGFEYRPSRWLPGALSLVAVLTLAAALWSMIPWWSKLPLLAAVLVATFVAGRQLAASPVAAAGWSADQGWTLRRHDHEDIPATLRSFRVLGGFVLLRLCTADHGVQVLLLAPDNSDVDIRRRLRMRLATIQPDEALPRI